MPQKTNLNISPYYDDYDKAKNFYKVLFKPGSPVQARELTGLQSILQNQIESFGKHIFKEGSMVIPGGIQYDSSYFSCKINSTHLGIDVTVYLDNLISANGGKGTRVRGQNSGIVATIKNYVLPPSEGVNDITIFVKYNESGTDGESVAFPDGEVLVLEENLTYGNTTINSGDTVLTLVLENASATGSSFGVQEGVYFIRGTFIDVPESLIVLDPYNNRPSYRVGFDIIEEVINANDDNSLYDNAKGFSNFAAPGADRFKLSVRLAKKSLTDFNDISFVELFRIKEGETKKLQDMTVYSELKKYFAKRTFEESGNYSVEPFRVNLQNSLNDEIGNNGLFRENQLTDEGNTPADNIMCVKLSPGTAYVRGFDVRLPGTTVLDVEKPRDTKAVNTASIAFNMGSVLKVNNIQGTPWINIGGSNTNVISLHNRRKGSTNAASGVKIGEARVYSFAVSDSPHTGASTEYDLHLYDIQTYTNLKLSNTPSAPIGTKVRGLASGAIGYTAQAVGASGADEISLSQTTGQFVEGETIIVNEQNTNINASILKINAYTTRDIKSVFQDSDALSGTLVTDFSADSVLIDRILPNFSTSDQLNVLKGTGSTNTGTIPGRNFGGVSGITTDAIISYAAGNFTDPVFNRVTEVGDGSQITFVEVEDVAGVCEGDIIGTGSTSGVFRVKEASIRNLFNSSLYSPLPRKNIATLNSANSNLIISTQVVGKTVSANTLTITTKDALDTTTGVSSAFFEPFDAEKYSIHYTGASAATETLTSDQFTRSADGNVIKFSGLSQNAACTVNVTLKKVGLTSKSKDYVRSQQLEVTRSVGISTNGGLTTDAGLTNNLGYGTRVEDHEISLNVPDVSKVVAVLESKTTAKPLFDKLTFVSGLNLDVNAVIGEKIIGNDSRAVAQIVETTANTVSFVYLNSNKFTTGEQAKFTESSITSVIQVVTNGNYIDRTRNYVLNKGHNHQFLDYSRIERKAKSAVPSKKLLIVFDKYQVPTGNKGDICSINSYSTDRYEKDIPSISGNRVTDLLDFRPRVKEFDLTTNGSPFSFHNREFEDTNPFVITPNESSTVGYSFYLPRIDTLVIDQFEQVKLVRGESAENPAPPTEVGAAMKIAQITLPPYLYDVIKQPSIKMFDNRRFTMRDIGALEKRIENLELVTSLSALELDTKTIQVKDKDGFNRFKSGFVVNNFLNRDFIDFSRETGSQCDVNVIDGELVSAVDFWSLRAEIALNPDIDPAAADLNSNLQLLDTNCRKTGDLITLDYTEVDWLDQPHASIKVNVNPFAVTTFAGAIVLDPPSDNWTRTVYVDNFRQESSGATWVEQANIVSSNTTTETETSNFNVPIAADKMEFSGHHTLQLRTNTVTTTQTQEVSFTNVLDGPSREFDYIESVKVGSEVDPFMRSRNVFFSANGLKPTTKHSHFLDSQAPDIVPKLIEIEMVSGSFTIFENARIELTSVQDDPQIGYVRVQRPNHKVGDNARPDVAAGLGSPTLAVEEYTIDPYDTSRPAPSNTYSATSKLFNVDVTALANSEEYFGYAVKGAKIIGETSGAVATITSVDLISDNWGDIIGAFFFRNANAEPKPPITFRTGTKTFRITAAPEGTLSVPGQSALGSDAAGTFTGTGVIITQATDTVGVRNPPPPNSTRPNETRTSVNVNSQFGGFNFVEAPRRDPLAQSFTTDETGAFFTSVDVYFATKDPNAKLFVELRTVELGTPTNLLVQDIAQVALNPNQINVSDDASIPTTIRFASPIYLAPMKEYALVFLAPSSDLYEMWVGRMGDKTIRSTTLPDVEDVVIGKQYLGGSLFKSQNGTIWTPSQYEDLCFKLRKASFVESGTATFFNTPIEAGNLNAQLLPSNPLRSLPRKLKVPVAVAKTVTPIGRKVSTGLTTDDDDKSVTGIVEAHGAAVSTFEIVSGGSGYLFSPDGNGIKLKSLTGSGENVQANLTVSGGVITGASVTGGNAGEGYQVGDVLEIITDVAQNVKYVRGGGFKVAVKATGATTTHLYLTDVQGETFVSGDPLIHYNTNNDTRTAAGVNIGSGTIVNGSLFTGDVFEVTQYNHAHHGVNNKITIKNVKPDTVKVQTTNDLTAETTVVDIPDVQPFTTFNGITTTTGEALIGGEIVSYTVGTGQLTLTRGRFDTTATTHIAGSDIQTYEAGGVSLVGINTTHDISTLDDNFDNYYLKVDVGAIAPQRVGKELLCFVNEKAFGGVNVKASQNHQFSSFSPQINALTPGRTRMGASVRTVSGTSAGGDEVSFINQGFEPTTLNETTFFPTPRLVASKVNEQARLTALPKNKSLTLNVSMSTSDSNLSPILDTKNATFILGRNKINSPIGLENYASDSQTNQLSEDPHGSIFVSRRVILDNPATSLKVLVSASVQPEADFRVYYRLFSFDSSEVSQTYRAFPGYKNLLDTTGDGFGNDIVDVGQNDGRPDGFVSPSRFNQFKEYQFTVDNLDEFNGFTIKIVMLSSNESTPVRLKDFRAIALA